MAAIERIEGRASAIAEGMTVVRALPTRQRRMVGAWCFLDHLGPLQFPAGGGMHVGAHPHTALQTFTWLIDGEVLHRDSLGSEQIIRPGQVNLMTAGRGIVHTEDSLAEGQRLHAAQLWIALPASAADCPPAFEHFPELPRWQQDGLAFTLLAGCFAGRTMPARLQTPLVGLDIVTTAASRTELALDPAFEYGILPLTGEVVIEGERFVADEFAWLGSGRDRIALQLAAASRLLLLGGEPFAEPVQMWWNFVGHSRQAIIDAQREWESGSPRFGPVAGDGGRRLVAPPLPWNDR
jgi:redox-sensitive bicupin YhaK (pirin superfamily)